WGRMRTAVGADATEPAAQGEDPDQEPGVQEGVRGEPPRRVAHALAELRGAEGVDVGDVLEPPPDRAEPVVAAQAAQALAARERAAAAGRVDEPARRPGARPRLVLDLEAVRRAARPDLDRAHPRPAAHQPPVAPVDR